ncbi:hypothetical protein D4764_16G0010570 [Takifugu flavidus]|uniref:Ig-like domain-containing protein n=1 Tax=Takifugu flavidus TaxID=433684 RepID=A0A5C6P311_9TELE|nr:hypothetical protein D4764_16G0010570 [Takifugu flavidus]
MPSLFTDVYLLTSVSSLHPGHVTEGVSTNQHTNVSSGSCRLKRFRMSRLLLFCCFTCVCLGVDVRQSVSDLLTKPGDKVQIFCSHDKTDYTMMLWYQRSPADTAMKLVGYLYFGDVTMEEEYKQNFNLSGDLSGTKAKNGSLMIHITGREEGAVYYCGASEAH